MLLQGTVAMAPTAQVATVWAVAVGAATTWQEEEEEVLPRGAVAPVIPSITSIPPPPPPPLRLPTRPMPAQADLHLRGRGAQLQP